MPRTRSASKGAHPGPLRLALSYGELGSGVEGAAERGHLVTVLARLIDAMSARSGLIGAANDVFHFLRNHADSLGLLLPPSFAAIDSLDDLARQERAAVLLDAAALFPAPAPNTRSSLDARLDFLMRAMGLTVTERAILGILARRSIYGIWQRLVEKIGDGQPLCHVPAIALMIGYSDEETYRAYGDKGSLKAKGLAQEDSYRGGLNLDLHDFVKRFIASDAASDAEMLAELMPLAPCSTLDPQHFAHMGGDLARARQLVTHALRTGERANILLYGVPGTGKTEFARLLADETTATAISVGEADDEGGEPTRKERLAHLGVCRKLVSDLGQTVLVIDEADDLFLSGIDARGSKLWLNRLVEDGKGPHVWIVNDPGLLGEPVVRRMDMAIRFEMPTVAARRKIVERMVTDRAEAFGSGDHGNRQLIDGLVNLETSPAILSAAMRTGAMVGQDADCVVELARDLAEASGRAVFAAYASCGTAFDPGLSVADCDLVMLANRLAGAGQNWSLLLSGPPGTGKSAYAHYLAERAGIDLLCVSGAELLGAFVGETERQIAAAFAKAERSGSLLLIDEADSFLANRDTAHRNWEVSMTNEMLRQMERGRVRFVATTNRAASLDPASARRFLMHAEFATIDAVRARSLFETSFAVPPPESLKQVSGLTPGDFAQVRQRAALLQEDRPVKIVEWLRSAVEGRDGSRRPVGF